MLTVRELDAASVRALATRLSLREETARCLLARGLDASLAPAYLAPKLAELRPPLGLAGFSNAVARLAHAVTSGETIGVFGDYDVDGVTAAAVLTTFLRGSGASVHVEVAARHAGYGFTRDAAESLIAQGARVIVTVDCGTQDLDAILYAKAAGADVVVVDHHSVPSGGAHPSTALVNPFVHSSDFPFRGLASVGLAFYLAAGLRTALRDRDWYKNRAAPDPRTLLDLVALGTVADLVPVVSENRVLTSLGLRELAARRRPGLAALLRLAGVDADAAIDERTIAFKLAPRLNAPGRLGSALPALELLLADELTAEACANVLETANAQRRTLQDDVVVAASQVALDLGPVVVSSGHGWSHGVVGIVAAKLVEQYNKPAVVIAIGPDGIGRGSARSIPGIDIAAALRVAESHTLRTGGHAAAAGVTLLESKLAAFREALARAMTDAPIRESTVVMADANVAVDAVNEQLANELELMAPFGVGNAQPRFVARARVHSARRVGDGSHLKLELTGTSQTRQGIGFGIGHKAPSVGQWVDVLYRPVINTFRGMRRVELEIADIAPAT